MKKINIGSDFCKIPNYTANIDIRMEVHPDIVMDIIHLGIKSRSIDEINLGNILEHLSLDDIYIGLEECRRILSLNGILFITLPLIDRAEESFNSGQITRDRLDSIIKGEGESYNSHKTQFRSGDLERILQDCGFSYQPLELKTFPYMVVADTLHPVVDPWQYGITARISDVRL